MKLKDLGKSLERGGKSLLRGSLLKLLPKPHAPKGPIDPAKVKRVLAVRHDARLGNLLLLTPSLRLLKSAFPNAKIEVLLADRYGDALKFNSCVDEILTAKSLPGLPLRGYDLAFDFSPQHAFSLSSAVWTALSAAKRRIGFDRGDAAKFLDDLAPVPTTQAHETANLASLVRHAMPGLAAGTPKTEYHLGPGEKEEGAKTWKSWGLDENGVALFLGARAEKRLDPEWFFELGKRIVSGGRKVVLTGGPAERKLLEGKTIPAGIVLAPELELRRFAATIVNARAVLTADTGPMHLAIALGVPTVQLFSHTEPWRFGYAQAGSLILETPGRHPSVDEAEAALSVVLARKG